MNGSRKKINNPMAKYIFRLDDVCSTMNWVRFNRLKNLFLQYNIKPIIAVVPDNRNSTLIQNDANQNFWEIIKNLQKQGWIIIGF